MHYDSQNVPLSQIIIHPNIEQGLENVQGHLSGFRIEVLFFEDFLIEHAKMATKAAYIAEPSTKFIIMASINFNHVVQNALLKLLEEPPRNIRFILIVPSKSILLPTVLSRLPFLRHAPQQTVLAESIISFKGFDLFALQQFVKAHERSSKNEAKTLLERLCAQALLDLGHLSFDQAHCFEEAFALLELNGKVSVIFTTLLLQFLPQKTA